MSSGGLARLRALRTDNDEAARAMAGQADRFRRLASPEARPVVATGFNLFPTPPAVADLVVSLAAFDGDTMRALEPSVGTGRLIEAAERAGVRADWVTVEIEAALHDAARRRWPGAKHYRGDFHAHGVRLLGQFERVVMNPPFARGLDVRHVRHALDNLLKPGGRLVSVVGNGPRQREALEGLATDWIDLPPGSFASEGTNVNAAIVVIDR